MSDEKMSNPTPPIPDSRASAREWAAQELVDSGFRGPIVDAIRALRAARVKREASGA